MDSAMGTLLVIVLTGVILFIQPNPFVSTKKEKSGDQD